MGLDLGIVDAHVHIWTSDTERYPLAPGFTASDMWTPSFNAEELLDHCRPSGVDRINLVQMTWYGLDHSYILDTIAADPARFCGTGMVPAVSDITLADQGDAMVALSEGGIYAFRVRGRTARPGINDGPQWMDHPGYARMFEAAAEHNLAISFLLDPEDLPEVDRMCARHPDTPVIIDHLARSHASGGPVKDEDLQALCRMARHRSVMVKVGGVLRRRPTGPVHGPAARHRAGGRRIRPGALHVGERQPAAARRPPQVRRKRGPDTRPRRLPQRGGQGPGASQDRRELLLRPVRRGFPVRSSRPAPSVPRATGPACRPSSSRA